MGIARRSNNPGGICRRWVCRAGDRLAAKSRTLVAWLASAAWGVLDEFKRWRVCCVGVAARLAGPAYAGACRDCARLLSMGLDGGRNASSVASGGGTTSQTHNRGGDTRRRKTTMISLLALGCLILSGLLYGAFAAGAIARREALAREAQQRATQQMLAPERPAVEHSSVIVFVSGQEYVGY